MISAPTSFQEQCPHEWEPMEEPKETMAKLTDIYGQPNVRVGYTCLNRCKLCGAMARLPVIVSGEVTKR